MLSTTELTYSPRAGVRPFGQVPTDEVRTVLSDDQLPQAGSKED